MTLILIAHVAMLFISVAFITLAVKRRGSDAFFAAVLGAVFVMSLQFMYVHLTGKVPAGLQTHADYVNENRAK